MRQRISTFILVFAVWIIFAGRMAPDVVIVGIVASLLTTILFGEMLFRNSNRKISITRFLHKIFLVCIFIPVFFYEALKSALEVSGHVFKKKMSFSPGIVKVKTRLTNVTAITFLANLITLTPGTLTLDFDKAERAYYIHWIDVKTKEEAEARKEIIEKFENWLDVIFR